MKGIAETAKSNKLLSSDDNLAIYMVLLVANNNNERLDVKEIGLRAEKNYGVIIDYNKVWRILENFENEGVIERKMNMGESSDKYYLKEIIYSPANYTPVPNYLLVIISLFVPVLSYLILYDNDTILLLISATSFITVIMILILHYFIFEVFQLKYNSIYTKRKMQTSLRVFLNDKKIKIHLIVKKIINIGGLKLLQ